ncbi:TPA: hypothetical protein ACH3X1_003391 [Trebouxia sp. C0004]
MLRACCCGGAVLLQLSSRLMGLVFKACRPFLRKILAKLLFVFLCVLVCLLTCFKILMKVLPTVLVITGNRKSGVKLEVSVFDSLIRHYSNNAMSTKVCMRLLFAHAYLPMPVQYPISMELYVHATMVASGRRHASTHHK